MKQTNLWDLPRCKTFGNESVLLEPLALKHAPDLFRAACSGGEDLFRHMFFGPFSSEDEIRDFIRAETSSRNKWVFAVFSKRLKRVVGSCALMNVDTAAGNAEIGSVWYAPEAQGSEINTAVVLVLAGYLFNELRYRRVVWKCDAVNLPSRHAAENLGFEQEGVFRKHMMIRGRSRDTVWYSLLDDNWPKTRESLQNRLEAKCQRC